MGLPSWYLEGRESGGARVLRVALNSMPFTIGRGSNIDYSLESRRVSHQHAEFFVQDGSLWLRDHESKNGTFVNGQRLCGEQLLCAGDIVHFADMEFRIEQQADNGGAGKYARTVSIMSGDAGAEKFREFRKMVLDRAVEPYYQGIISLQDNSVLGYELLGRGHLDGQLLEPPQLFMIAETLGLAAELSTLFRDKGIDAGAYFPADVPLFVNSHPTELRDEAGLLKSLKALRQRHPDRPVVLEIHESSVTDSKTLQRLGEHLIELNIDIAFDDFGTGQARLLELSNVAPRYLKFDGSLIRDLHLDAGKRRDVVKTLVRMALDMGIVPIAEGIEKGEELNICRELGFHYGQGFYFDRPQSLAHLKQVDLQDSR